LYKITIKGIVLKKLKIKSFKLFGNIITLYSSLFSFKVITFPIRNVEYLIVSLQEIWKTITNVVIITQDEKGKEQDFLVIWYLMWLYSGGCNIEILIIQWWPRNNRVIKSNWNILAYKINKVSFFLVHFWNGINFL